MNNEQNNLNGGITPEVSSSVPPQNQASPNLTSVPNSAVAPNPDADMMMATPNDVALANPSPSLNAPNPPLTQSPADTLVEPGLTPAAPVEAVMTEPAPSAVAESLDTPAVAPAEPPAENPIAPTDPNTPVEPSAVPGLVVEPAPGATEIEPFKEEENEPKKKKPNKIVLIVLIIATIIILLVGGGVAYLFFGIKPQKIHNKFINEFFNTANSYVTSFTSAPANPTAETMIQNGVLTFNTNIEEIKMLNNYSVKYTTGSFAKDNSSLLNLSLLEKNQNVLSLASYYIKNELFVDSPELYEGLISFGNSSVNMGTLFEGRKVSDEDVRYILDQIKNALLKSLDNKKYDRKLTTIKVGGKDTKAFNNSYKFDTLSLMSIEKSIVDTVKDDEKSLSILASLFGLDASELKANLDKESSNLETPPTDNETSPLQFNVYTSVLDSKILAAKMYNGTSEIFNYSLDNGKKTFTLTDENTSVVFTSQNNTVEMRIVNNHEVVLTLNYTKESDNKSLATFVINTTPIIGQSEMEIGNININMQTEKGEKETNQTVKISVLVEDKDYEININNKITTSYEGKMPSINTTNAIDYTNLDINEVQSNLLKALEGTDLYALISGSIPEIPDNPEKPEDPEKPINPNNPGGTTNPGEDPGNTTKPGTDPGNTTTPGGNTTVDPGTTTENPNCKSATCKDCSGNTCKCTYLDDSFNEQTITCPNPNN